MLVYDYNCFIKNVSPFLCFRANAKFLWKRIPAAIKNVSFGFVYGFSNTGSLVFTGT